MLPPYVCKVFANALQSLVFVCSGDRITPIIAAVRYHEGRLNKIIRSYPEAVNYLKKRQDMDQTVAEPDTSFFCHMKPFNTNAQQNDDDPVGELCKNSEAYHEGTLCGFFIESDDATNHRCLRDNCIQNPWPYLTDIAIQSDSILFITKGAGNALRKNRDSNHLEKRYTWKPWNARNTANVVIRKALLLHQKARYSKKSRHRHFTSSRHGRK